MFRCSTADHGASTRRYLTRSGRVLGTRLGACTEAVPRPAVIALGSVEWPPGRARQFAFPRTIGRTCRKLTVGARSDSAPPAAARRSRHPPFPLHMMVISYRDDRISHREIGFMSAELVPLSTHPA